MTHYISGNLWQSVLGRVDMIAVPDAFKTIFVECEIECAFLFCTYYSKCSGWHCLLLLKRNFLKGDNT